MAGVAQQTVSKWESGTAMPTPANFSMLATLASGDDRLYFLRAAATGAGIDQASKNLLSRTPARPERGSGMVFIPLLKDSAAAGTPRALDEKNIETQLEIPAWMCPKAKGCVAIRVTGDSMSPILEDGYIVLVDTTQRDPKKLVNEMVAARDSEGGVTFKWLRKMKNVYVLMPNHTSIRHDPIVIDSDDDYAVVGRIVHFIGQPPRPKGRK
jgi:SOS-response transcriptional repressor LexA